MKKIFLGITGASGAVYAERIIQFLSCEADVELYVSGTPDALINLNLEKNTSYDSFNTFIAEVSKDIKVFDYKDFSASVASGSFMIDHYIVVPASMGTVGRIASGVSSNLIERCIDVGLKESRDCIILFREMPLNQIHLENLLKLSRAGVKILPASPGYYHGPETVNDLIDFVVGKIFDIIKVKHNLFNRWE